MSTELPKDPETAAAILAALEEKDKTLCTYPTCQELRQVTTGTGRPSSYCGNPDHNPVSNHRARQQLKAVARGVSTEAATKRELPRPSGVAPVESLRASVVSGMLQLQGNLERYLSVLTEIADPDLSAAQIQATLDRAEARVAEAQQSASAERSLRLAADTAALAAEVDARAEREAAEQAIEHMEETEARIQRLMEETERHIAEIQMEQDETINRMHIEAQRQREEIQKQAREAITEAQVATVTAQEEARQANIRAHDAEAEAHAQIATAERLVSEARATLDRERAEVDRLRSELAAVRTQAEQATMRADRLAIVTDELRAQLIQMQTEREKPNQA